MLSLLRYPTAPTSAAFLYNSSSLWSIYALVLAFVKSLFTFSLSSPSESILLLISILFLFCLLLYFFLLSLVWINAECCQPQSSTRGRIPNQPWHLTTPPPSIREWTFSGNVAILWGQRSHVLLKLFWFKVNGSTLRWPETLNDQLSSSPHIPPPLPLSKACLSRSGSGRIGSWDFLFQQPQRLTYIFHTVPDTVNQFKEVHRRQPAHSYFARHAYLFLYNNNSCLRCQLNVIPDSKPN